MSFDWEFAGKGEDNELFFVRSTCQPGSSRSAISVWIKQYMNEFRIKGVVHKNVECKVLYTFDCRGERIASGDMHFYKNGKLLTSNIYQEGWKNIVPESIAERLMKKVCEMFTNF